MATRTQKDEMIAELIGDIKGTNVLYLADASSMDAEATSNLRRACNNSGIRMRVVKNTLLRKAMERIDPGNRMVLRPYLGGEDVNSQIELGAARWIVDFTGLSVQEARAYAAAFAWIEDRVHPYRKTLKHKPKLQRVSWGYEHSSI